MKCLLHSVPGKYSGKRQPPTTKLQIKPLDQSVLIISCWSLEINDSGSKGPVTWAETGERKISAANSKPQDTLVGAGSPHPGFGRRYPRRSYLQNVHHTLLALFTPPPSHPHSHAPSRLFPHFSRYPHPEHIYVVNIHLEALGEPVAHRRMLLGASGGRQLTMTPLPAAQEKKELLGPHTYLLSTQDPDYCLIKLHGKAIKN